MKLLETSFKICFFPDPDPEIISGMIYSAVKDSFPKSEKTPITQLPSEIRESDGNLRWMPTHIFRNEESQQAISVGNRVCIFTQMGNSCDSFEDDFNNVFNKIEALRLWKSIIALEFKTVMVGDFSKIMEELNFSFTLSRVNLSALNFNFQSTFDYEKFMHNIIITDVATIQEENEDKRVSVLDVSTKTKQIDGEVDIISSFRELRKINLTLKDDILK